MDLSELSVFLNGSVWTISISDSYLSVLSLFLTGSVHTINISEWICPTISISDCICHCYQYFWLSVHPTKETKVGRKCWLNKYDIGRRCWLNIVRLKTTIDIENDAVRVFDHVDVANITFENSDHIPKNRPPKQWHNGGPNQTNQTWTFLSQNPKNHHEKGRFWSWFIKWKIWPIYRPTWC